jgi:RNA polymerase sigma factor (sigma-70 family)
LALAAACSAGNSAAWDTFVAQYRPELYRAGRAIAGDSQGRELADSLYAELFGLRESEGERKSLFEYFHGRSKLGTWLRAILAQRHVDNIRRSARTESLDEPVQGNQDDERPRREVASPIANVKNDPERETFLAILQATMKSVLGALEPRDRLRLAYYYVDELTLAQIGKLMGEHEATVSRKIERTRRDVRKRVEASLRQEKKMSEAQLAQCLEYAREEWPFDLSTTLSGQN